MVSTCPVYRSTEQPDKSGLPQRRGNSFDLTDLIDSMSTEWSMDDVSQSYRFSLSLYIYQVNIDHVTRKQVGTK